MSHLTQQKRRAAAAAAAQAAVVIFAMAEASPLDDDEFAALNAGRRALAEMSEPDGAWALAAAAAAHDQAAQGEGIHTLRPDA